MTREALYVAVTRGRTGTNLYVESEQLLGLDAERPPAPKADTLDKLAARIAPRDR
jgi:ATP-dependent exoDNAse (exonuclease V) alpha subunit